MCVRLLIIFICYTCLINNIRVLGIKVFLGSLRDLTTTRLKALSFGDEL